MDKLINTLRAVVMFTLLLLILIFCFQNRAVVDVKFLNMQVNQLPVFIALIGTLATGLLIGFLAGLIKGTKSKRDALRVKEASKRKEEDRKTASDRTNNTNT